MRINRKIMQLTHKQQQTNLKYIQVHANQHYKNVRGYFLCKIETSLNNRNLSAQ